MNIKPSRNGKITPKFTVIGKSCLSCEFETSQICLLTLFAKKKFSRKFSEFTVKKHNIGEYLLNSQFHV